MINRLPSLTCAQGTGITFEAILGKPIFSYNATEESRSGEVTYTQETSPSFAWAVVSDGLMLIGLHQTKNFSYPAVTYFGLNTENRTQQLKQNGVKNITPFMGNNNVVLKTWEGLHFFLFSAGM